MIRTTLAAILLAGLAGTASAQEVTPTDEAIQSWVERNPEVILNAINAHLAVVQNQEAERSNQLVFDLEEEMFEAGNPTILGNPNGSVEMVYFLDAACGFCKRMVEPLDEIVAANPDLKIIQRWVPFLTPDSRYAGIVATIVQDEQPEKLGEFYKTLMGHPEQLDRALVDTVIGEVFGEGAEDLITRAAVGPEFDAASAQIEANFDLAQRAQVQGTPFFYVRGAQSAGIFRGATGAPELQAAIDAAE